MRGRGLAQRTIRERIRIVRQISYDMDVESTNLSEAIISDWLAKLPVHTNSRASYFAAISAWCAWLFEGGHRDDDPSKRVGTPKSVRRYPRPADTPHIEAVLASSIQFRTRLQIELAAYQGLRVHEIAKFDGSNIDLLAKTLKVIGKGGVAAVLPLHSVIADRALVMPRKGLWFPSPSDPARAVHPNSVSAVISRAFDRVGAAVTAHQLRHWYGTTLLEKGVDVRIVQELMRHESLATTALYTRVNAQQMRHAMERLPSVGEQGIF